MIKPFKRKAYLIKSLNCQFVNFFVAESAAILKTGRHLAFAQSSFAESSRHRNVTMLKNGLFMSNQRLKKDAFLKLFFSTLNYYPTTFFELLITHERFIFEESYIWYGKRQKSCTLIVICVKCLYLTSPIFNSSSKSNRTFYLPVRKYSRYLCSVEILKWDFWKAL